LTCELPIVTTEKVGASVDLVESGKNGYIIKSNNTKGIASAIEKIFENNLDKNNNSWEIVQKTRVKNNLNKLNLL
jgi:glycosyltransferase involved in cell wall biosynthesis